ncbi:hypothetical protein C0Q70_13622 [Pomacea canaliculata]|uniref:Mammalian ependymin-related protein 1 n=2 Tax=Pomacea canaliculata TaxID=400727 RepID=A0A2T7NXS4_POMCA|nr:hypothetical protein C0Q70_13622 [Pomacea canaliculata]
MRAVVLLSLIAVALAQQPSQCPGPSAFSGRFRRIDRERQYFVDGRIWYDELNRRVREFEAEEIGRDREFIDRLVLYNLNIEYTVNLRNRTCTVSAPRRPFVPYGVPPDARFQGEGTAGVVGKPGEEVTLAMFSGTFSGENYFVSVTEPDCFPVQFGLLGNQSFFHQE